MKFKVYFDYEEEDSVEVEALTESCAKQIVVNQMIKEHGWDEDEREGMFESLNAEVVE